MGGTFILFVFFFFFFWLCRTEKLRDYCPLLIITLCDSLIFWQRYLKEESPSKVLPKNPCLLFLSFFLGLNLNFFKWEKGQQQQYTKLQRVSFLMYNNRSLIFIFSMRESSKNQKNDGGNHAGGVHAKMLMQSSSSICLTAAKDVSFDFALEKKKEKG